VAVSAGGRVTQNEVEKKLKYKSLYIKIQLMWDMKCVCIQIVTGATGIVSKAV